MTAYKDIACVSEKACVSLHTLFTHPVAVNVLEILNRKPNRFGKERMQKQGLSDRLLFLNNVLKPPSLTTNHLKLQDISINKYLAVLNVVI